jgi:hypothetical protein
MHLATTLPSQALGSPAPKLSAAAAVYRVARVVVVAEATS